MFHCTAATKYEICNSKRGLIAYVNSKNSSQLVIFSLIMASSAADSEGVHLNPL